MSGHLGVQKTKAHIPEYFWWPSISLDTAMYVRSCHTCQMVWKHNQKPHPIPLKSINVLEEQFSERLIDIAAPLPTTSNGFSYILTIMDWVTLSQRRFVRSCTSKAISQALLKFFTQFCLHLRIRSGHSMLLAVKHYVTCISRPVLLFQLSSLPIKILSLSFTGWKRRTSDFTMGFNSPRV